MSRTHRHSSVERPASVADADISIESLSRPDSTQSTPRKPVPLETIDRIDSSADELADDTDFPLPRQVPRRRSPSVSDTLDEPPRRRRQPPSQKHGRGRENNFTNDILSDDLQNSSHQHISSWDDSYKTPMRGRQLLRGRTTARRPLRPPPPSNGVLRRCWGWTTSDFSSDRSVIFTPAVAIVFLMAIVIPFLPMADIRSQAATNPPRADVWRLVQ